MRLVHLDMPDQLVVQRGCIVAGLEGQPQDGVQAHAAAPARGAQAGAFDEGVGDAQRLARGQGGAEPLRAGPRGETRAADGTA